MNLQQPNPQQNEIIIKEENDKGPNSYSPKPPNESYRKEEEKERRPKSNQDNDMKYGYLKDITLKQTVNFKANISGGKVVDVYDGDTITVASKIDDWDTSPIYRWKIRQFGIDTPEIRTKDLKEKEEGIKARDFMRETIMDKYVRIEIEGNDKYGRVLASVYLGTKNLSDLMVKKGYAAVYDGGKKAAWVYE